METHDGMNIIAERLGIELRLDAGYTPSQLSMVVAAILGAICDKLERLEKSSDLYTNLAQRRPNHV